MHVPLLSLTCDDPLTRPDLLPILQYASRRSVPTALTVKATPELTRDALAVLKECGLMRIGFWLNGSTAALHESRPAETGRFQKVLETIGRCHEAEMPVQVNTTISRRNFHDLDPIVELVLHLDVCLWDVFFFVPANRGAADLLLDAEAHENVFEKLYHASNSAQLQIHTTEGQHYERYLLQRRARKSRRRGTEAITDTLKASHDTKQDAFIDHAGNVFPSRFLPLSAGNITSLSLAHIYRESRLFVSLRDRSKLKGKCGRCEFREVCGGSRARAYAVTGDALAEEPCCAYEPR